MRDRLIELICESIQTDECIGHCNHPYCNQCQNLADHLLANGVIVPPLEIGQTVYSAIANDDEDDFIDEYTVDGVGYIDGAWYVFDKRDSQWYKFGTEDCKPTREEAEKALERSEK